MPTTDRLFDETGVNCEKRAGKNNQWLRRVHVLRADGLYGKLFKIDNNITIQNHWSKRWKVITYESHHSDARSTHYICNYINQLASDANERRGNL